MKSRNLVVVALGCVLLALLLVTVCEIARCERARKGSVTGQEISLLPMASKPTPSREANDGSPGLAKDPTSTPQPARRPVFGTEESQGTEIVVPVVPAVQPETVRLFVGRDGKVENRSGETVVLGVRKVGPAWIQWDPAFGLCAMGWTGKRDMALVREWHGLHLDAGVKMKLLDFCPALGLEVGLPALYVTTAGPGVGVDLKHDAVEWLALDAGWFPFAGEWQVGVSVSPFRRGR